MSFLALTPLQALLLAAVTAGTIIALYFLKLRHRRVFVSSSMLWRRVLDEHVNRIRFGKNCAESFRSSLPSRSRC